MTTPDNKNPFYDEWRDCLRQHYRHVIRTHDDITEPTLRGVLHSTGFSDEDIDDLLKREGFPPRQPD